MEYELRYYFNSKRLYDLKLKLDKIKELSKNRRRYEKTIQYDNSNTGMSFYDKKIDGRFRVRMSKFNDSKNCMLSWKRRINTTLKSCVNKEEEVELSIKYDEYPFGIALEIENKSTKKNPEDVVKKWAELLGLDINQACRLSWMINIQNCVEIKI